MTTVLVVDDEPQIVRTLRRAERRCGGTQRPERR